MEETESNIVRSICDYLELKHHCFWRQNTAPTVQKTSNGWHFRKMAKHSLRGVPDIILIKQGQFVGLEVKKDNGRLSADQVAFAKKVQEAGAQYHVVRSIDDVIKIGL